MTTVVSVCNVNDYDWKSAIDYEFDDTEEAMSFLRLYIKNGFKCLVYEYEDRKKEVNT